MNQLPKAAIPAPPRRRARKKVSKGEDFNDQSENWFAGAAKLVELAESGDLAPEQGGGYVEHPWWRALVSRRAAVAAAALVFVIACGLVWVLT